MADASIERIVNLALSLACARGGMSAVEVRARVSGYPGGQSEAAFLRMFERDKETLREAGLVIVTDTASGVERYRLDTGSTFAAPFELDAREALELRAAGIAMLTDRSFPYAEDLRLALTKLAAVTEAREASVTVPVAAALTADEDPEAQGEAVALLTGAAVSRKRVSFGYTGHEGRRSSREVEPYGLFAREGRWYLVANDPGAGMRVFAVSRMADLSVNGTRPKSPDFERPEDFDVRRWMLLPFQYGPRTHEALVVFSGAAARRAEALSGGQGALETRSDGTVAWRIEVADDTLLARWTLEAGPGIRIEEPAAARDAVAAGLAKVVAAHGS